MSTKVVCPDCGGILGETSPGEKPCTCFLTHAPSDNDKSDTAALDAFRSPEKLCVVCGKDTVGHRRLKDSRGYICYPCAKAEKAAEKAGKVRCQLCRKLVKPEGLVPMGKKMVCRKCFADFEETARFRKKVSTKHYDKHEWRNVIILGIIFVILGIFVVISLLRTNFFSS